MGSVKKIKRRDARHPSGRGTAWFLVATLVAAAAGAIYFMTVQRAPERVSQRVSSPAQPSGWREAQKEALGRYAGSASCRECHTEAYAAWATSHHGLAERGLDATLDGPAFEPGMIFRHGKQQSKAWLSNDVYWVHTLGMEGETRDYAVTRVIGHDPLRQFLVEVGGRMQTLEVAYDPRRREWFNVYGEEDRQPGEWGHWTGRGMTWNSMCATCHNTRLYKNYLEPEDRYETTMAERGVGCESCHGPMKEHVNWRRTYPDASGPEPGYTKLEAYEHLETCGTCHSRRYELTGDFEPGDRFADHFALTIVDGTDLYYPDGQVREENYEYASFLSSRMHAAGVTCLDCHHPHLAKPSLRGDLLCMRCHSGQYPNSPVIDPAAHSYHRPEEPGGRCVDCHMPVSVYMQRHPRHDHGFTIPDPLLTKEYGIPNACNRCHQDKDADWALASVRERYGERMERRTRQRAGWVARARRGEVEARDALIGLLGSDEIPYWKAVGANLLDMWAAEPAVTRTLLEALDHTNALVRLNAVHSLGPLIDLGRFPEVVKAIRGRLGDSTRAVRQQAAWALRALLDPDSPVGRELTRALDYNADFPSGQMQKGVWELDRDNPERAVVHYERAAQWDPNSAALRHDYGVVLSRLGRVQEALRQMEEACRLEPTSAEYQFKLGLAWNEAGGLPQGREALAKAVALDPKHARAWYNLGLACHQLGQISEALDALQQGENLNPREAALPYTAATILAREGRLKEAKAAARRALEAQPEFPAAEQLLLSLPE